MTSKKDYRPAMKLYFPTERAKRVAMKDLKRWYGTASAGIRQLIYEERRRRLKIDKARKEIYEE